MATIASFNISRSRFKRALTPHASGLPPATANSHIRHRMSLVRNHPGITAGLAISAGFGFLFVTFVGAASGSSRMIAILTIGTITVWLMLVAFTMVAYKKGNTGLAAIVAWMPILMLFSMPLVGALLTVIMDLWRSL